MNRLFLPIILLFLASLSSLTAQEYQLPVSSNSEAASKAYQAATYLASNVRFDAARVAFEKCLEADPNYFMAYAYMYQALAIDPSNFTEAEKITRQLLLTWKADPQAKPAEAMKALTEAYPNTVEAFEWAYLHAFYTDRDPEAGYAYAQRLIELDPYFPPVYNSLGYYYMGKKDMDKARAAFAQYLELAPAEPNAHDSMGEYYMAGGDYAKALAYYEQAVALGMEASKAGAEKARTAMEQEGK